MKVVLTDAAWEDLVEIGRYIAADNPARAASFVDELLDRCQAICDAPEAFPLVPRYADRGIRRRVYGNYLIFYRISEVAVEVIHVLHGARNYERLLFPDD